MISDREAIAAAREALLRVFGTEPSTGETIAIDAVAQLETSRGDGWKGAGAGSFNMGAIQCGASWKGDRFSYVDTHPNADGTSTKYRVDFRKYKTRADGLRDLVQVMYVQHGRQVVRAAAQAQDWLGVSAQLHATGYYEGFGKTVSDRIANHCRALLKGVNRDLAAIGRGLVVPPSSADKERPTLRFGTTGEAVKVLQRIFGIAADGIFGRCTLTTVQAFQAVRGLRVDGVVGPATWDALGGA